MRQPIPSSRWERTYIAVRSRTSRAYAAERAASDGVIHTAFIHDFNNYGPSVQADQRAIETLGAALIDSGRPLIVASGTLLLQRQGPNATEEDASIPNFPRKSEDAALALVARGVRR